MLEPKNSNVARSFAYIAFGTRIVAINCGTVVFFIASLGFKAASKKSIAA